MIRVMIVATYSEVREGLCTVLNLAERIEIAAMVSSLSDAVQQAGANCPDVALVDLEMPGREGFQTIRQLSRLCLGTKTIALTAHDYPAAREDAFQAGAHVVIVKGLSVAEMIAAIQLAAGSPEGQQERNHEP